MLVRSYYVLDAHIKLALTHHLAKGVRNLQHLTTTVATQKLAYEFPYSSFDLDTDLAFIVLSEGKALIPVRPNL